MGDESRQVGGPTAAASEPRATALHRDAGQEAASILSAAQWIRFDLARIDAMWHDDRLQGPDPLAKPEPAPPTLDDFHEAARRLHETAAELIHHVNRAVLARE